MQARNLFTIGYEGTTLEAFVAHLRAAGVETIVDVRELPLSRKKGFSKGVLSSELREVGIDYVHVRSLGCPRDIRLRYRSDGSWTSYTRDFLGYLSTQRDAVIDVAVLARTRTSCLLCFEADFDACHRTYVARAVNEAGGPVVMHLRVGDEPVIDPKGA